MIFLSSIYTINVCNTICNRSDLKKTFVQFSYKTTATVVVIFFFSNFKRENEQSEDRIFPLFFRSTRETRNMRKRRRKFARQHICTNREISFSRAVVTLEMAGNTICHGQTAIEYRIRTRAHHPSGAAFFPKEIFRTPLARARE